ncbi:MAG: right-handed parallel beta-helix repeat-containing protein, partial [Victivallales bacterium]
IYTLGVQPGTVIRGNLIHNVDSHSYGGWGIYLDEGSSHIIVENNICYDFKSEPFHTHYGRENMVRNNIFAFGRGEAQITLSRGEEHVSFTFERNIVITREKPVFMNGYGADFKKDIIKSDSNIFWSIDSGGKIAMSVKWGSPKEKLSLAEWRKLGRDLHSIFEDPGFKNALKGDFRLKKDSPALKTGFTPFKLR